MKLDFGSIPSLIGKALQGVFGSANKRSLSVYNPIVRAVNELTEWAEGLSQEQVQAEVAQMKAQVADGELELDDAMPKMFALTRESAWRALKMRHFDVQLIGGAVLHHGGSGTTAAALHAGCPQVVCPFIFDQFGWAERVEWAGVGARPPFAAARSERGDASRDAAGVALGVLQCTKLLLHAVTIPLQFDTASLRDVELSL